MLFVCIIYMYYQFDLCELQGGEKYISVKVQ